MKTTRVAVAIGMLSLIALGSCPVLVIASGKAYAETVFSDFGTSGPNYFGTSYGVNSYLGVQFTSADNVSVSQIDVVLYYLESGTNAATVSLITDPGGDPSVLGTTLGSWSLGNLPTWGSVTANTETISDISGINLMAGDSYFLLVSDPNTVGWDFNSDGVYGTINWGGSIRVDRNPLPTFDILGTASTPLPSTPLPASLPLFATGLGVMGLIGWRRKRKNVATVAA